MNGGIGRIIVGILFIVLGGSRVAMSKSDGLRTFGFVMAAYGLFSIGHGIYKLTKGNDSAPAHKKPKGDEDETLDSEI